TAQPVDGLPEPLDSPEPVETPGATTIEAVSGLLGVPAGALIKAFPADVEGRGPVLALVRGDHRLNEIKLQNALGGPVRPADEQGISWPRSLAPFDAELVGLGKEGEEAREVAERLYDELRETGLDVLYDDRAASPGEKFADAELVGCPLRITVGRKSVEAGQL